MLNQEMIKIRKKKGVSQLDLAEMIGVSRQMVSLWERGICLPNDKHLQAICSALGLPDDYFSRLSESALDAEQEAAVAVATPSPAPEAALPSAPSSAPEKTATQKKRKIFKGLLLGLLLCLCLFALAVILAILITSSIGAESAIYSAYVFSFYIPIKDRIILVGVFLAIVIAILIYLLWRNFHKDKKK